MEADETFMGGKIRESERRAAPVVSPIVGRTRVRTAPSWSPLLNGAGKIRATVVQRRHDAQGVVRGFVLPGTMIFTDDWSGYNGPAKNNTYRHRRINHTARVYVDGPVHTQTIEGFFGHFKTDVRGTHHAISAKWVPGYLNEWVWKGNHREDDAAMFTQLLANAAR